MAKRSERPAAPALLTTDEVAARLAVDPSTVRRWIDDGRLPATRPGRSYRIDPDDLDELLRVSRPLVRRPVPAPQQQHLRRSRGVSA